MTERGNRPAALIVAEHRLCGTPNGYDGCYAHFPIQHCRADGMSWPCDVHDLAVALRSERLAVVEEIREKLSPFGLQVMRGILDEVGVAGPTDSPSTDVPSATRSPEGAQRCQHDDAGQACGRTLVRGECPIHGREAWPNPDACCLSNAFDEDAHSRTCRNRPSPEGAEPLLDPRARTMREAEVAAYAWQAGYDSAIALERQEREAALPNMRTPEGSPEADIAEAEEAYRRAYPTGWRGGHRHFIAGWKAREAALPEPPLPDWRELANAVFESGVRQTMSQSEESARNIIEEMRLARLRGTGHEGADS